LDLDSESSECFGYYSIDTWVWRSEMCHIFWTSETIDRTEVHRLIIHSQIKS